MTTSKARRLNRIEERLDALESGASDDNPVMSLLHAMNERLQKIEAIERKRRTARDDGK